MNKYLYRFICSLIMVVSVTCSFGFVWIEFIRDHNQTGHLEGLGNILMALLIYLLLFIIIGNWLKAFKIGVERKAKVIASAVITVIVLDLIEIPVSMAITGQFRFCGAFLWRYALLAVIQAIYFAFLLTVMINVYRKVIPPLTILEIKGENENKLAKKLNNIKYKYSVRESVNYREPGLKDKLKYYDAVLINDIPLPVEKDILTFCFAHDKRVYVLPSFSDIILKSSEDINRVDTPLFLCRNLGISKCEAAIKRGMDIFFSCLGLIVLSPLFGITALAIKLDDGGPIFFRQERVTYHEKRFMILKFRSMIVDAEKDGRPHPAGENDDRITRVGHMIRACRIDELPQLINILKGEMSIVGPRPERWEHVEQYTTEIPEFIYRYKVKGGLTGYAQVYGKYNTSALDKLKMDLMYITNYSLLLDIQIIFETLKILFIKDSTEGFEQKQIDKISGE